MKAILSSSVAWIGTAVIGASAIGACGGVTDGTGVDPDTFIGSVGTAGAGGAAAGATATGMAGMSGGGAGMGAAGSPPAPDCDVVAEVFTAASCSLAGCHASSSLPSISGVPMHGTAAEIATRMLDVESETSRCTGKYIDSQNPEQSILLLKVSADYETACPDTAQMPSIGDPLDAEKTACLRSWVLWVASGASP